MGRRSGPYSFGADAVKAVSAGGAPGGAASPGGGPRKPAIAGRARLGMGFANPILTNRIGRLSQSRQVRGAPGFPIAREPTQGASQTPGASRRSIPLDEREEENGERVFPHS